MNLGYVQPLQNVAKRGNGGVLNTLFCYASVAVMAAEKAVLGILLGEISEHASYSIKNKNNKKKFLYYNLRQTCLLMCSSVLVTKLQWMHL